MFIIIIASIFGYHSLSISIQTAEFTIIDFSTINKVTFNYLGGRLTIHQPAFFQISKVILVFIKLNSFLLFGIPTIIIVNIIIVIIIILVSITTAIGGTVLKCSALNFLGSSQNCYYFVIIKIKISHLASNFGNIPFGWLNYCSVLDFRLSNLFYQFLFCCDLCYFLFYWGNINLYDQKIY